MELGSIFFGTWGQSGGLEQPGPVKCGQEVSLGSVLVIHVEKRRKKKESRKTGPQRDWNPRWNFGITLQLDILSN